MDILIESFLRRLENKKLDFIRLEQASKAVQNLP